MSGERRTSLRWHAFLVCPESEREEPFLNKMGRHGWHLEKAGILRYRFKKGAPRDEQYRMDFLPRSRDEAEYRQLLADTGWEFVGIRRDELGRWIYVRRPQTDEAPLEIYTDPESKLEAIAQIKKAYTRLLWLLLPIELIFLAIWFVAVVGDVTAIRQSGLIGGVIGGLIGGGGVYIWAWISFRRKVKRIERNRF